MAKKKSVEMRALGKRVEHLEVMVGYLLGGHHTPTHILSNYYIKLAKLIPAKSQINKEKI